MSQGAIERLIAGSYPDPDGGAALRVDTRAVVIADSLAGRESELVAGLTLGRRLVLVSDPQTHGVLGRRVERALGGMARVERVVLAEHPHADDSTAAKLGEATRDADALIAVGSGTINDLCKYVAAEARKPYAVFGTAPSMNGYTSSSAAITVGGHKKSLAARVPVGVFLDLGVLAAAPPRMIRSGLGDSLCRPTAQADWLLAHLLRDEPYRRVPFELLAGDEPSLLEAPEALLGGDLEAMATLARTLVLSGFGMTLCGGSYPASQGEHLISHYAEMMRDPAWPASFHGEQIGVTTLTMARLQEQLLSGGTPELKAAGPDERDLEAHFGVTLGRSCWRELSQKLSASAAIEALNARLARDWPRMRTRIERILVPSDRLQAVLTRAGAPTDPEALGWPRTFYRAAVAHAREIRNRYTFLDLAADAGRLESFVASLT